MENMNAGFYQIRAQLAELHNGFQQGMEWWKKEMDNLKAQVIAKDKEIADLKRRLNEK